MKNDFIESVTDFTNILTNHSLHFLSKNFEIGDELKEAMDIVLSSHLSALFNVMKEVSKGKPNAEVLVEDFISAIQTAIKNLNAIQSMEKVNE